MTPEFGLLRMSVRTRFVGVTEGPGDPLGGVARFDYYGFGMLADEWQRMGSPEEITISVRPWDGSTLEDSD